MTYESTRVIESRVAAGVTFTVVRMSFERRLALMQKIRELARRVEFLEAGGGPLGQMDAALLQAEIDRTYVAWGLRSISGLELDGSAATPETLSACGPEEVFREALAAVRAETGLSTAERKN